MKYYSNFAKTLKLFNILKASVDLTLNLFTQCSSINPLIWAKHQDTQFIRTKFIFHLDQLIEQLLVGLHLKMPIEKMDVQLYILVLIKVIIHLYQLVGPVEHCYPDWKEGVNKAYWGVKDMPPENAPKIHLEMKAGDIVFFHPYLFHGSGENRVNFIK